MRKVFKFAKLTAPADNGRTEAWRRRGAAFTLAEVLITLGIIGVVAAITTPALIANHREKVTVSKLTQTYNILLQAINRMIQDQGETVQYWGADADERRAKFEELLPKYINIVKKCEKTQRGCLSPTHYTSGVIGAPKDTFVAGSTGIDNSYLLNNGVAIKVSKGTNCVQDITLQKPIYDLEHGMNHYFGTYACSCIDILADINGPAGPNKTDIDAFRFAIVQDGIVPLGSQKETVWTQRFDTSCVQYRQFAYGNCTAWVIFNKNMDYLRCPDKLGWNKQSSCKQKNANRAD